MSERDPLDVARELREAARVGRERKFGGGYAALWALDEAASLVEQVVTLGKTLDLEQNGGQGAIAAYHAQLDTLGAPPHKWPCVRVGRLVETLRAEVVTLREERDALRRNATTESPSSVYFAIFGAKTDEERHRIADADMEALPRDKHSRTAALFTERDAEHEADTYRVRINDLRDSLSDMQKQRDEAMRMLRCYMRRDDAEQEMAATECPCTDCAAARTFLDTLAPSVPRACREYGSVGCAFDGQGAHTCGPSVPHPADPYRSDEPKPCGTCSLSGTVYAPHGIPLHHGWCPPEKAFGRAHPAEEEQR